MAQFELNTLEFGLVVGAYVFLLGFFWIFIMCFVELSNQHKFCEMNDKLDKVIALLEGEESCESGCDCGYDEDDEDDEDEDEEDEGEEETDDGEEADDESEESDDDMPPLIDASEFIRKLHAATMPELVKLSETFEKVNLPAAAEEKPAASEEEKPAASEEEKPAAAPAAEEEKAMPPQEKSDEEVVSTWLLQLRQVAEETRQRNEARRAAATSEEEVKELA